MSVLRAAIEDVIEALIDLLDTMDGDSDLERVCEDEGWDSDREPEETGADLAYAQDGAGGDDQRVIVGIGHGVQPQHWR